MDVIGHYTKRIEPIYPIIAIMQAIHDQLSDAIIL
jgi:hypothetical protein